MSLENRINALGDSIRLLVTRLTEYNFKFERPDHVLSDPEISTPAAIARIEREVGALPLALKLFWQNIGSVDFCGSHPGWHGCDLPDPLVVHPPSVAIQELDEFLAHKEERLRCDFPYVVPIAPDLFHKADVSGGMWYNVSVPAVADDPPLNDEWHRTTFVGYLELAVQWSGFPGLSRCPGHSWPIDDLRRARSTPPKRNLDTPFYVIRRGHWGGSFLELGGDGSYESCQAFLRELREFFGAQFSLHLDAGSFPYADKEHGYWKR